MRTVSVIITAMLASGIDASDLMAAQTAMMSPGPSRDYYLKKHAEGLIHAQALLALARRRVDVLWAMLRDKRHFTPNPPATQSA